jgi:hypothetical protein
VALNLSKQQNNLIFIIFSTSIIHAAWDQSRWRRYRTSCACDFNRINSLRYIDTASNAAKRQVGATSEGKIRQAVFLTKNAIHISTRFLETVIIFQVERRLPLPLPFSVNPPKKDGE